MNSYSACRQQILQGAGRMRRREKGTTWHGGFNREEEVWLVVVGELVERLVINVAAVYVAGAVAIVAGARVAGVAKERVATPATIGNDNSCQTRW